MNKIILTLLDLYTGNILKRILAFVGISALLVLSYAVGSVLINIAYTLLILFCVVLLLVGIVIGPEKVAAFLTKNRHQKKN